MHFIHPNLRGVRILNFFYVKQQRTEATDTFIRKKRALFAKLENVPKESDQIVMIFGMVNLPIRYRVLRHNNKCFG